MLRAGWTPKQFRRLYPDYTIQDVVLAVYPQSARKDTKKERAAPMSPLGDPEKWDYIQGIPIEDD